MKTKALQKIHDNVCRHVRATLERIDVKPERGLFNFRCHENCAEWARTHEGHEVFEVMYIDGGDPILHYVNRTPEGVFLETTLGFRAAELEYYLVRRVHPAQYALICQLFGESLDDWLYRFTNVFHRRILGIGRVV